MKKKLLLTLTLALVLVLMLSVCVFAKSYTTIYSSHGSAEVPSELVDDYVAVGWSKKPVKLNDVTKLPMTFTKSSRYGYSSSVTLEKFDITGIEYIKDEGKLRIHYDMESSDYISLVFNCYNSKGEIIKEADFNYYMDYIDVPSSTVGFTLTQEETVTSTYTYTGKYKHFVQIDMYAMDGRGIWMYDLQAPIYKTVGWYEAVEMYAADGRTCKVPPYQVTAYEKVGWYTVEGYLYYLLEKEVNTALANKNYNDALALLEEYGSTLDGTKYEYSVSLLESKAMDKWRSILRCPIAILDYEIGDYYGTTTATIYVRNISYKKITAFKLQFTCYNIFGEVEDTYYDYYYCDDADLAKIEGAGYTWKLYGADSVDKIKNIRVTEVVFADGTKW